MKHNSATNIRHLFEQKVAQEKHQTDSNLLLKSIFKVIFWSFCKNSLAHPGKNSEVTIKSLLWEKFINDAANLFAANKFSFLIFLTTISISADSFQHKMSLLRFFSCYFKVRRFYELEDLTFEGVKSELVEREGVLSYSTLPILLHPLGPYVTFCVHFLTKTYPFTSCNLSWYNWSN